MKKLTTMTPAERFAHFMYGAPHIKDLTRDTLKPTKSRKVDTLLVKSNPSPTPVAPFIFIPIFFS